MDPLFVSHLRRRVGIGRVAGGHRPVVILVVVVAFFLVAFLVLAVLVLAFFVFAFFVLAFFILAFFVFVLSVVVASRKVVAVSVKVKRGVGPRLPSLPGRRDSVEGDFEVAVALALLLLRRVLAADGPDDQQPRW